MKAVSIGIIGNCKIDMKHCIEENIDRTFLRLGNCLRTFSFYQIHGVNTGDHVSPVVTGF